MNLNTTAKMCNSILQRKEEGGVKTKKNHKLVTKVKTLLSPTSHKKVQRQVFAGSKAGLVYFLPWGLKTPIWWTIPSH